jgi:hypothetical protein
VVAGGVASRRAQKQRRLPKAGWRKKCIIALSANDKNLNKHLETKTDLGVGVGFVHGAAARHWYPGENSRSIN